MDELTKADLNTEEEVSQDEVFEGFVVGIGASAGGLEALEQFFKNCPEDKDLAYVVVQHLSPDHKSMMLDLLGRYTEMEVVMVKDGMSIRANTIHLIPAGQIMRIGQNAFELTPKAPHTLTLPIDIFFNSLADSFGNRSIGIILSGTGSDGTRGSMAINAAGGFLMAQDAKSAKFDGMPSSVIGTEMVDAILPAEELPNRLLSHIKHAPNYKIIEEPTVIPLQVTDDDAFDGILQMLLQSSGIDFRGYKLGTILRRIERRMQVRHLGKISSYFELLQNERQELGTLKRELLISVTNFFRDTDSFKALELGVIEKLVKESNTGSPLRVWIAGVATGEEAYSIGMLFLEAFEKYRRWPNIKIFATDVSQDSVDIAAAGIYSEALVSEIETERLERFFQKNGNVFEVKPELRQMIVFAKHNLLADPPFTQMDLVCCRNTLIYFTPESQRKAFQRLQFASKTDGYLFLGSSETITTDEFGFVPIDGKNKIFKRNAKATPYSFNSSGEAFSAYKSNPRKVRSEFNRRLDRDTEIIDKSTRLLIEKYSPPSILVNDHSEIIHLFGNIQPYFELREGAASLHINRVLPKKIIPVASALMYKATKDNQSIKSDFVILSKQDGSKVKVRLSASIVTKEDDESLLLLSFEEQALGEQELAETLNLDEETIERVEILEGELTATRESLQATIEELETSNEELQATNEELMASNEELQSSNEELQSVNEELNTVNSEYQEKVSILNKVNADLDSMTKAVGVPTVFVDNKMNLTRFSPDAVGIFRLRDTDIGRPLDEITNTLKYDRLMHDIESVLRTERMIQKEVPGADNQLFLIRILPYSFSDRRGAVATFVDITVFRERERLQAILDGLPEHIAVLEADGTIALVNKAWEKFAKANGDPELIRSGVGSNYLKVCFEDGQPTDTDAKKAYFGVKSVLEGSEQGFTMQYPCHSPTEQRWFVMNAAPIQLEKYAAVVSHINISTWYDDK